MIAKSAMNSVFKNLKGIISSTTLKIIFVFIQTQKTGVSGSFFRCYRLHSFLTCDLMNICINDWGDLGPVWHKAKGIHTLDKTLIFEVKLIVV